MSNNLFIISAPSGTGKTTICKALKNIYKSDLYISISFTTREKRVGEENGIDYNFINKEQFKILIKENKLLEWEEMFGNYYGTPKDIPNNKIALFDVDVKGALSLKKYHPQATLIFLRVPNTQILKERLHKRGHSDIFIKKRTKRYNFELNYADKFDYVITNDNLDLAIKLIDTIIKYKNNIIKADY